MIPATELDGSASGFRTTSSTSTSSSSTSSTSAAAATPSTRVLDGDEVRVEKELFGDAFRRAPRLTPLEARAIRLALEFVGPMIAAEAHTPLDRRPRRSSRRRSGSSSCARRRSPRLRDRRGGADPDAVRRDRAAAARRDRVPVAGRDRPRRGASSSPTASSARCRTGTCTPGTARATRRAASASTACAARRCSTRRSSRGPDSTPTSERATPASGSRRRWPAWRVERGAAQLADGSALEELRFGSPDWLVGEILSYRGEAVVLEPEELRARVAERARELLAELTRSGARRSMVDPRDSPPPGRQRAALGRPSRARWRSRPRAGSWNRPSRPARISSGPKGRVGDPPLRQPPRIIGPV